MCGCMNLASVLEGGAAPEEGDALGEQTAGPGAARGSVHPTGNQRPRSSASCGVLASGHPAGSAHPPVCQQVVHKCQALGITAKDLSDTRTITAHNHAQKRQSLK